MVKQQEEKERKNGAKKKKTIQKRNQNLSMARKKLTKKNLKTNSYLMMKEFNSDRKWTMQEEGLKIIQMLYEPS